MFNPQRLQYFHQVVLSGSVRAAADILQVDPSSISRSVALLEKETGFRLLERRGRGVVPTEVGKLLASYAKRQMVLLDTFLDEVQQTKDAERGHVDLCLGEGMLDMFFYPLITDYMRAHPDITLSLTVASAEQNVCDLVEDKADIGLLYSSFSDVRLRQHGARPSTPIQTIVHKNHPLAAIDRPLMLADLAQYAGATLHEHFGLRQYIRAAEISEQVQLRNVLTTSSYRALWQFANAGLGYTVCGTSFATWFNMPELLALPMANPIFNQSTIAIVTRVGRHLPAASSSLLRHLITHIPKFSGALLPALTADEA